jgi:hypothetical protein
VHRIPELAQQGTPIAASARTLPISRPTVRKYLEGAPAGKAYATVIASFCEVLSLVLGSVAVTFTA